MKKIVFVCTGNTCRSPMAMAMFNKLAGLEQPDFEYKATSAGIAVSGCLPPSEYAVLALQDFAGIDITKHRSRMLKQREIEEAYLVLTMTQSHKRYILSMFPETHQKVFTLKEYVYDTPVSSDIQDPYGGSLPIYKMCLSEIAQDVEKLIKKLKNK